MTDKLAWSLIFKSLLLGGWLVLFLVGLQHYSGSSLSYTLFSIVFLMMLISGFYRQVSYGYLFLVVMLWLGFWLKLTVHSMVDYPFGEPIGFFIGTPAAWDNVLLIATIGSLGVMAARLLYGFAEQPSSMLTHNSVYKVPAWYLANRRLIWVGAIVGCVGLAIANAWLGIQQSGLVPNIILLWPLNAIVYWLLASGLSFGIATLLWWDIVLGRNVSFVVYFVLLEAFTSTVSILSRGAYLFHAVPQLFALYKFRALVSGWSQKNIIAVSVAFVLLFALSNPLVNSLRNYYYSNVNPTWPTVGEGNALTKFVVDRWLGAEGVMAVAAYPIKGGDLFIRGLTERAEIGKSTIYQEICQAHYRFMDMKKFQFASLPGAVGFLYFSGYLWVVALGMIVLVLGLLVSEGLVFRLTRNPLLSALWGGGAANAVAQLGVAPRGLLFYFFELSCGIAAICFVQSDFFSKVLQKSNTFISVKSGV